MPKPRKPTKRKVMSALLPSKGATAKVTADELRRAWPGLPLAKLQLICLDREFTAVNLDVWRMILAWSNVDKYKYSSENRDCDNFAAALHGHVPLQLGVNGVGYVVDFSGGHAYSALLVAEPGEGLGLAVVEPQSDAFVAVGDQLTRHEMYKAERGFVIFA